jgi:hypothetical protein
MEDPKADHPNADHPEAHHPKAGERVSTMLMEVTQHSLIIITASGPKPKRKPRAPPRSRGALPGDDALQSNRPGQALKETELVPTAQTVTLNNWNSVKDKLTLSRNIEPTQADLAPMSWNLLPIRDDRAFQVVEIRPVTSTRCRPGVGTKKPARNADKSFAEEQTESWEIDVQDTHRPNSSLIVLFPNHYPPKGKQRQNAWRGGILETRFCDREAAGRVAQEACERLNPLPVSIDAGLWNDDPHNQYAKMFLEAASMFAIDANFDHSLLDPIWRNFRTGGTWGYTFAGVKVGIQAKGGEKGGTPLWKLRTYNLLGEALIVSFKPQLLDTDRILTELADAVPNSFHYVATPAEPSAISGLTEDQHDAGNLFARYLQYLAWGLHCDQPALNTWLRRRLEDYALPPTIDKRATILNVRNGTGPCDGDQGWHVVLTNTNVTIRPTKHVTDLVEGEELPNISPATRDPVLIAHILQ